MSCEGKTKAIIALTLPNGTKETIISLHPPVSVSTQQTGTTKKVYVHGTAYDGACHPLTNYDEYRGTVSSRTQVSLFQKPGGICPNGVQYDVLNAGGTTGTEWVFDSCSIKEVYDGTPGCQITITDNTGTIYHQTFNNQNCPTYQVTCDDDCPPGYCKIDCPHYPGYCCISCAEIDSLLLKLK